MVSKGIKFTAVIPVVGLGKYNFASNETKTIVVRKFSKSEARNWGSKKATSSHLIHIDTDNEISKSVLKKAKRLIETKKAKSIVLEEYVKNPTNIWQRARAYERKILAGNNLLATPQIIEKKLFNQVGGYDERFNELDDWALFMRLRTIVHKTYNMKHATSIHEPTNIFKIIKRRFNKGREIRYFKEVYGNVPQTSKTNILKLYIKNPPSFPLLILKFFDWGAFYIGSLFPVRPHIDSMYNDKIVAKNFDGEQKGIYGRLKNFLEIKSIFYLLVSNGLVLDLGCGTGRITKELFKRNYQVTPADTSKAMLSQFPKSLPKPVFLKTDTLPFKNNYFDAVISMRVIWHIKDKQRREKFFTEAVRVAKKEIIIDFSILSSSSDHQFNIADIKSLAKKHNLIINSWHYLPMARILIKFIKS